MKFASKKISSVLIVVILLVMVSACQNQVSEDRSDENPLVLQEKISSVLGEVRDIQVFDTLQREWLLPLLKRDSLLSLVSISEDQSIIPDSAFAEFLTDYVQNINVLNDLLLNSDEYETLNTLIWADTSRHDARAKLFARKIQQLGYSIDTPEGILQLERNTAFLGDWATPHFSEGMKAFWQMYHQENLNAFAVDASIQQPLTDIVDRIVYWERFKQKYPEFVLSEHVDFEHRRYIYFLFAGMDNTPAFSYAEDEKLEEDFLKAYYYAIEEYPDTEYSKIVGDYLDILEEEQNRRTSKSNKFLEKFNL